MPDQKNIQKDRKNQENLNNYSRYSGIAVQMLVIISIGVIGGMKMDKWLDTKKPVFTALFSLLGVVLAIYIVIKDLIAKK